eukprot:TRINITY_DN17297_c1_g1_i2.p2 TRINITY_DN17297_c1_g1~~TRINITY_DN17297_c1_g1_i2.p2  ORF type:complete len:207 (+),score=57.89 TRINITY_DN17297_c1_g1_i2:88-621(+)
MLLCAVGYYHDDTDHWTFTAADHLLLGVLCTLCAKVAMDVVNVLYLLVTGRRDSLQKDVLSRKAGLSLDDIDIPATPDDSLSVMHDVPTTPFLEAAAPHNDARSSGFLNLTTPRHASSLIFGTNTSPTTPLSQAQVWPSLSEGPLTYYDSSTQMTPERLPASRSSGRGTASRNVTYL